MKFVAIIDGTKKKPEDRVITLIIDHDAPVPPVIPPEEPDAEQDTEPPKVS